MKLPVIHKNYHALKIIMIMQNNDITIRAEHNNTHVTIWWRGERIHTTSKAKFQWLVDAEVLWRIKAEVHRLIEAEAEMPVISCVKTVRCKYFHVKEITLIVHLLC